MARESEDKETRELDRNLGYLKRHPWVSSVCWMIWGMETPVSHGKIQDSHAFPGGGLVYLYGLVGFALFLDIV